MIAVVDYGVGNLFSLGASLKKIGAEYIVTKDKDVIKSAKGIILPG
ncbi:MAG: imidazole glycerol phosphate synthase subunit HisH, partial [Clostridiales bacterium]|nr:imidazole glycerol phosphate synthase subunit HisH [Clostridiales bacterium]